VSGYGTFLNDFVFCVYEILSFCMFVALPLVLKPTVGRMLASEIAKLACCAVDCALCGALPRRRCASW
jgi:hypothetical protein